MNIRYNGDAVDCTVEPNVFNVASLHFLLTNTVMIFSLLVDVCMRVPKHYIPCRNLWRRTCLYFFILLMFLTLLEFLCGKSRTCRHAGCSLESMLRMHTVTMIFVGSSEGLEGSQL